jgi:hypothetical protein
MKLRLKWSLECRWKDEYFKHLGNVFGGLTEHKYWEIEHYFNKDSLFLLELAYRSKCDHGGIEFNCALLGYTVSFHVYDNRHWNPEQNKYEEDL